MQIMKTHLCVKVMAMYGIKLKATELNIEETLKIT